MVILIIFREAFFKAGDLHSFQTVKNRTFRFGTPLCHFKRTKLLFDANLASEAWKSAQSVTYRRRTIANAGRQDGTSLIFLGPTQILDISTGSLVIDNFYENYFCTFIKNYHYCTCNVVENERFFAPSTTSMKSSKWV